MSKKTKIKDTCEMCLHVEPKWVGNCPKCKNWNTFTEEVVNEYPLKKFNNMGVNSPIKAIPISITDVNSHNIQRFSSGVLEFDRVLGGGIVPGSLVLVGGEPGVGKSTLLAKISYEISNKFKNEIVLYCSGEETVSQVANRTRRVASERKNIFLYNETCWEAIKEQLDMLKPKVIILDSIQTTYSQNIQSIPGSPSQIKEVAYELMNYIKSSGVACFIVGHITKEGTIAGPKILEHMVDSVIYFEGEQNGTYRVLRSIKNRFGATNELGIFEMKNSGLNEIRNPSEYFLEERLHEGFGRSLSCILEGNRPLFLEIQALVVENKSGNGVRSTQGIDQNRLTMLIAIFNKYFDIPLAYNDIYINIVGSLKLTSREVDLGIIVSLLSSINSKVISTGILFVGEVGLTGEIRNSLRMEDRIKEMARLKYECLVTSSKIADKYKDKYPIKIIGIQNVNEIEKFI